MESARKCGSNEFVVMNGGFPQLFGYVTLALTFILLSLFPNSYTTSPPQLSLVS